jgi:hypothetical protein
MPAAVERAESPALARARTLYNSGDYEGAIDAASVSRRGRPVGRRVGARHRPRALWSATART